MAESDDDRDQIATALRTLSEMIGSSPRRMTQHGAAYKVLVPARYVGMLLRAADIVSPEDEGNGGR